MAEIKLTKNELRQQQKKLEQLQKYLPVLQLKKMMLQEEVNTARAEIAALRDKERLALEEVYLFSKLFTDMEAIDLREAVCEALELSLHVLDERRHREDRRLRLDGSHVQELSAKAPGRSTSRSSCFIR